MTNSNKIQKIYLKPQKSLENQIWKFELMSKLQKQISKNKNKKVVIESNPKNEVLKPIYKNQCPKLEGIQLRNFFPKLDSN